MTTDERRIEWMRLDDLVPARRNSRRHDLPAIGGSIRELGFFSELKVDESTGELVWGQGRLAELRRLRDTGADPPEGIRDGGDDWLAPVVRGWRSRDRLHADAVREADNAVAQTGGFDPQVQLDVLADLAADRPDYLRGTGRDAAYLDRLLTEATGGATVTTLDGLGDALARGRDDTTRNPFDRPTTPERDDDEAWNPGRTVVDPEERPEPAHEEPPGDLDRAPAFRTLHPTRAVYHPGGPDGAAAVMAWLRGHAAGIRVENGDVVLWDAPGDPDGWQCLPGRWATRDGQTGRFDTWSAEEFAERFVPANEPGRRLMRDAKPV